MLTVHALSKSFDTKILFENVSFSLNPGDRTGLVGPNGCGKTTLLRILTGAESPTAGTVTRAPRLRLGYLPQHFDLPPSTPIGEIIGRAAGGGTALEDELADAAAALAQNPDDPILSAAYDELLQRIEAGETGHTAEILAGFDLDQLDLSQPASTLSGGQRTRLSLAMVLLSSPQLLLLDEPTNHLDIEMLEWLEAWLQDCPCGALIISHDRTFLDHTVTGILEMDPLTKRVKGYAGNYSDYLAQREAEIERQWADFQDQEAEVQRMKQDIARVKAQAAATEQQAQFSRHEETG